jgi:3'-phosphoadenosine 5'-phosphosulfate sulfotransferase (PAPS reductase)/FAD synthetase
MNLEVSEKSRVIAWFSCGAASAVATKLALDEFPGCIPVYCDTGAEHEDNKRFLKDCEKWFGKEILVLRSKRYKDIWDVFERGRYLVGVKGAMCTGEMKKRVRNEFQSPDDIQIFGFDSREKKRAEKFIKNNPELNVRFPLIELGVSKDECFTKLMVAGIELPAMYRLGYRNNNCIGCVKGQAGYWNKIRKDFPEVFERMAKVERKLDVAICKTEAGGKRQRLFLDELPEDQGRYEPLPDMSCGLLCGE